MTKIAPFPPKTIPPLKSSLLHCLILTCLALALVTINSSSSSTTTIATTNSDFTNCTNMSFALKKTREFPVLFLSHAAPVLIMKDTESIMGRKNTAHFKSNVANWYRQLPKQLGLTGKNKPSFIVQFSAHYEARRGGAIKVMGQDTYRNGLLYDYYGFPEHTYGVKYPAAGSLGLAKEIVSMLKEANVPAELDQERGIDHGGFIPLMLMYPEADIPVLQISIVNNASMQRRIGEILAPLRTQGVLFMGSGQATHGSFSPTENDIKQQHIFVKAFTKGMLPANWTSQNGNETYENTTEGKSNDEIYKQRAATVDNWGQIPGARFAHPHYDHYMPMPGCQGTTRGSENQQLHIVGDEWLVDMHSLRSYVWGEYPFQGPEEQSSTKDEL